MKIAALVVVILATIVAAVVAFLPASLVDGRIASFSQGKLRLADASGTVWEGRGVLTDGAGTWRMPVGWSISKTDVLRGVHVVALKPVDGAASPTGALEAVDGGLRMRDVRIEVPAQALFSALPIKPLPAFGGVVSLAANDLAWNQKSSSGGFEAHWRGARVASGDNVADLGTVDLVAVPRDARLAGRVTNSGGDVRIDGNVTYAGGAATVDATLTPNPGAPANIARSLAAIGTPDASGSVRIGWRGNLR